MKMSNEVANVPKILRNEDKGRRRFKQIVIEEYFSRDGDKILYHWRFPNQTRWNTRLTPLKEVPWVEFWPMEIDKLYPEVKNGK